MGGNVVVGKNRGKLDVYHDLNCAQSGRKSSKRYAHSFNAKEVFINVLMRFVKSSFFARQSGNFYGPLSSHTSPQF